jgi:hypothetical protein
MRDLLRQLAVAAAALSQALVPALNYLGIDRSFDENVARGTETAVVPDDYAFAIWGPIFLGAFAFAVFQARHGARTDPLLRRIGWPLALAYAGNGAWSVVAQADGPQFLLVAMLAVVAAASVLAHARVRAQAPHRGAMRWCADIPTGLLAGWTSFAVFANLSVALSEAGLGSIPASATAQALVLLCVATALGMLVAQRTGSAVVALVILWALLGVLVQNTVAMPNPVVAAVAGALALLSALGCAGILARSRR